MIVLSSRFAIVIVVLLLASAIPVWIHRIEAPRYDDCGNPDAFFRAPRIGDAVMRKPEPRSHTSISVEGRIFAGTPSPVRVLAFRTDEPSRMYASPMSFGFDSMAYIIPRDVRWLDVDGGEMPVHWSQYEMQGKAHVEAYAYVQGGRPIRHPLESNLRLAVSGLFEGARPLTVLIASASAPVQEEPALVGAVENWFEDAWRQMKIACDS